MCTAFRERGHNAYSCDIQECSGGHPGWHIKGSCLEVFNGGCSFKTQDGKMHEIDGTWDIMIAHPPCTYLAVIGNKHFNIDLYANHARQRYMYRDDAIAFFLRLAMGNAKRIAIENPVGIMSSVYRKPDQIIQPYEYGHATKKSTCLWLKNLPKLIPTNIVEPVVTKFGFGDGFYESVDENGRVISWDDPRTSILRSKTFSGIADAMADQWGGINYVD